ncbi:hypothetical protein PoB_007593100 [Plakobranchus ocellatus]|uniref:Uncharacterized protein n=1 Tax=Plakobranchus ocellatus TaxID=259542 RepID=A0AAV4E009_9GAST|nr:hypothetical protein PoB_007593100 [Plakobranchus ocellatus]
MLRNHITHRDQDLLPQRASNYGVKNRSESPIIQKTRVHFSVGAYKSQKANEKDRSLRCLDSEKHSARNPLTESEIIDSLTFEFLIHSGIRLR